MGGCRVTHFFGSTEQQYARVQADGVAPLFAFVFYTAAWFAIEQRAIRNATGWALPDTYLDEDSASEGGLGRKESRLLQLIRAEHASCSLIVLTDDIQSEKLSKVLPSSRRSAADQAGISDLVRWMRRSDF